MQVAWSTQQVSEVREVLRTVPLDLGYLPELGVVSDTTALQLQIRTYCPHLFSGLLEELNEK